MVKHIFSDMDGTLLNEAGALNERNVELIKQSQIPFTLVSARAPMEMEFAMTVLNLQGPQIAFNGGLIFTGQENNKKIIDQHYLDYDATEILLTQIKQQFPNVSQSFYDLDDWYTEKIDDGIKLESGMTNMVPQIVSIRDYLSDPTHHTFKIMLISFDSEEMKRLKQFVQELGISGISAQQAGANYFEITDGQAKKSHGINYVMEQEHLTKSETAAFGDGHNDLPMLEMVGNPIVMDNAAPEIKTIAKYITKSNIEDGVGYGITHYLQ
jgi:Cof subfamily protein (haloacid dehalogenase superfamily)